ncbi:TPA: type 1 fimbrial protein [Pseudomonas aeruginosa]|nr:type 1 fimbrial protein [Pseudomonas aeruginosa]
MPLILSREMFITIVALTSLALASPTFAVCRLTESGKNQAQNLNYDLGRVTVLPSTPVGGVIKELVNTSSAKPLAAECTEPAGNVFGSLKSTFSNAAQQNAVSGFANVYATDVSGIGIRLTTLSRSGTKLYTPFTATINANSPDRANSNLPEYQISLELIKTSVKTGSGLIAPNGRFASHYYDGDSPSTPIISLSFNSPPIVVSPTCEVLAGSRNIAVDFGSVANTTFTGVGSHTANRDFEIRLNCQGSNIEQYQSKIGLRIDADQDSSNMPGVLKLNPGSDSANRIGIQIVRRDGGAEREVHFGEIINIGTTTPDTNIMFLPLRARYVQTQAGTVNAGVANGLATFTIQYE